MNKLIYPLVMLLLTGCATLEPDQISLDKAVPAIPARPKQQPLTPIGQVRNGMTYEEVMALMGNEVKIGFSETESSTESYGSMVMRNPYRIEMLTANEIPHLVVYFLTQINQSDGEVTDDELTPVVFKDNIMIGQGWDYIESLQNF
ncbi:MAG: DUF3192 domain-containing protein [Candidatus Omnitrophica bacterium]|nr:DUF3192 domain-containing protein [Candidatus Omnitrophota bacterium]